MRERHAFMLRLFLQRVDFFCGLKKKAAAVGF